MIKKLLLYFIFLISFDYLITEKINASCNFKSADYIKELDSPQYINGINIKVPKSKKYITNLIKAFITSSTNHVAIDPKYKKKFLATIEINYDFGSCSYKGKIWQNGDYKDHIEVINGNLVRSLNVKLDEGNILNATKFKLFLPNTRNGKSEILTSLIFKNLGYISPETFETIVSVNGEKTKMIFQEDAQKELLEKNQRRENPILEGDENLIWTKKQFNIAGRLGTRGLEEISLTRIINKDWFLKGESAQNITINALGRLQKIYLDYANNEIDEYYYLRPDKNSINNFSDYYFLMLTMNSLHGLRPHNRKFYFNSFTESFEPIYYDGPGTFNRRIYEVESVIDKYSKLFHFQKDYIFPYLEEISNKKFYTDLEAKFSKRLIKYKSEDQLYFKRSYKFLLKNINYLQEKIKSSDIYTNNNFNYVKEREIFIRKNNILEGEKFIIKEFKISKNNVDLSLENNKNKKLSLNDFSKVIGRKKVNGNRFLFLPKNFNYEKSNNLSKIKILKTGSEIIFPKSVQVKITKKKGFNIIDIYQSDPNQTILIRNGILKNYKINFFGKKANKNYEKESRFNARGLTGCLNIYNSNLESVSFKIQNGMCEDSINIVKSKGEISDLNVSNSFQDAIDLDFSKLNILNILVDNASNDCIDLSGGNYFLNNVILKKCFDKSISAGEKSKVLSNKIIIEN